MYTYKYVYNVNFEAILILLELQILPNFGIMCCQFADNSIVSIKSELNNILIQTDSKNLIEPIVC